MSDSLFLAGMFHQKIRFVASPPFEYLELNSRDRIVVSTLRCGRSNPGSNPGHGSTQC